MIESFTIDPLKDPQACLKKLLEPDARNLDLRAASLWQHLRLFSAAAASDFYKRSALRTGSAYQDLVRLLWLYPVKDWGAVGSTLEFVSPFSPQGVAVRILKAGTAKPDQLAEWEKVHASRPVVQEALAWRHQNDGRIEDAVRCWFRRVELSPDVPSYEALAALHKKRGKDDLWLKALEGSLEAEDTGLGHARVRVEIARHFMSKRDFASAEPYALAAGESYAQWALICAAECQEGLEKWKEADALYRAMAERYDGYFTWYFACRHAGGGKMDFAAAEKAVAAYLGGFKGDLPAALAYPAGRFYLMSGQKAKALQMFDREYARAPGPWAGLLAALTADGLGDAARRDKGLKAVAAAPADKHGEATKALAGVIRDWAEKGVTPDGDAVVAAREGLAPRIQAEADFLFGWYLANRGQPDRAVELWKRCVEADAVAPLIRTHAQAFLDARKPEH